MGANGFDEESDDCMKAHGCMCGACAMGNGDACGFLEEHDLDCPTEEEVENFCKDNIEACAANFDEESEECKTGLVCMCAACAMDEEDACNFLMEHEIDCPKPPKKQFLFKKPGKKDAEGAMKAMCEDAFQGCEA